MMQDYKDFNEDAEDSPENEPQHFFCKLTFGQFFTMMVLELITLCFVFYLGARYGNEYLKLDSLAETQKEPASILTDKSEHIYSGTNQGENELQDMARNALQGDKVDLKQRVQEILARQQGQSVTPIGENQFNAEAAALPQNVPNLNDFASTSPATVAAAPVPLANAEVLPQNIPEAVSPEDLVELDEVQRQNKSYELSPKKSVPETEQVVKVKSGDAKFAVQVGSYPDVKEASYRVEEWKAKGYPAYLIIANLGEKGQWYRVRVGAFSSMDDASGYLGEMKGKEGITDAFVVKNEQ